MPIPLSAMPPPCTVPCLVTTETFTLEVEGIPAAAASVNMLIREYELRPHWKPVTDPAEAPYAFVALGFRVHAAWFRRDRYVEPYEPTACGTWFHTRREPLLGRAVASCAVGPCASCLTAWRAHYGN